MKFPLLFVLPILLGASERQNLPVVIKSYDPSCKNHVAADVHPSLSWLDEQTAVVRVRVPFEYGVSASDESPGAYLEGKHLYVCYNINVRQLDPGAPTPMCLSAADLEFTISKLPQGEYSPHVSWCGKPKVLLYKCTGGGKSKYSIYEAPDCTAVVSGED